MAEIDFGEHQTSFEKKSTGTELYYLKLRCSVEEMDDDMTRTVIHSFSSVLNDLDEEDLEDVSLTQKMEWKVQEGSTVPHSRSELSVGLVEFVAQKVYEEIDETIEYVTGVEVEMRKDVYETPYDDMQWDPEDDD